MYSIQPYNDFKGFKKRELLTAILYTSGSTGTPKGVRVPQQATLNRLQWQWQAFPYSNYEVKRKPSTFAFFLTKIQFKVCCFKTALTFVDSISEIFGPLLTGRTLVIVPKVCT